MLDCKGVIHAENGTKTSWPIGLGVNYDEN